MSSGNVDVVRRAFEAFQRDDLDSLAEFLDSNVEWHAGDPTASDACHSRAQALAFMRRPARRPRDQIRIVDLIDHGDQVVVITEQPGVGEEPPFRRGHLATLTNGRITSMIGYETPETALAAAGLDR